MPVTALSSEIYFPLDYLDSGDAAAGGCGLLLDARSLLDQGGLLLNGLLLLHNLLLLVNLLLLLLHHLPLLLVHLLLVLGGVAVDHE